MESFGKYLMKRGVISPAQLDEATQSQVVFGGRLGTNLVELGYLSLGELEKHLSEHLGVPIWPGHWLERPSDAALKAVPVALAERYRVLPLALEEGTLHLAMADPRNPSQVDDIAFATGLRIRPYVMAEVRLSALQEHHFGIPRDLRYINLGREAAQGHFAKTRESPGVPRGEAAEEEAAPEREGLDMSHLERPRDLIDEQTFSTLHQDWHRARSNSEAAEAHGSAWGRAPAVEAEALGGERGGGSACEASAATAHVAALEKDLASAADRDSVGALALRIARLYASGAALFVVRGGMVSGFLGDGEGMAAQLDGILIPVEVASVFTRAVATRAPFRGKPAGEGIDTRLLGALSRADAQEILVHPIAIRGRVINLLYADNGPEPLGEINVAALAALCCCVSSAYERLILERKGQIA